MKEEALKVTEATEKLQSQQRRLREVEIERDLLISESRKQSQKTDSDANQVGFEIDNLRSEFAKLKFEKEGLMAQIEIQKRREQDFSQTVDRL